MFLIYLATLKIRPTQHAADGGYAPRFLSICLALGFSRFDGESTLPPTAANAKPLGACQNDMNTNSE